MLKAYDTYKIGVLEIVYPDQVYYIMKHPFLKSSD